MTVSPEGVVRTGGGVSSKVDQSDYYHSGFIYFQLGNQKNLPFVSHFKIAGFIVFDFF